MKVRKLFIAAESITYVMIVCSDISGAYNADLLKFSAIVLCLLYSAYASINGGDKLVTLALAVTLCADVFLLLLNECYTLAVALFCAVQGLYFVRIFRNNGRRSLWAIRVLLLAAALAALLCCDILTPLNILAAVYFTSFVCNLLQSFSMGNRVFSLGLMLFICCDICVGMHNLQEFSNAALNEFTKVGMWLFYLPSQVFISLSGEIK